MQNPQWHERMISPHTLVYTGFRWHVRAYCHQSKQFKDFLLSRIDRTPVVVAIDTVDPAQDQQWHEEIMLTLMPNPKLNESQKALAHYTLQRYQAAITLAEAEDALKYPLVLQLLDIEKLSSYLFDQVS